MSGDCTTACYRCASVARRPRHGIVLIEQGRPAAFSFRVARTNVAAMQRQAVKTIARVHLLLAWTFAVVGLIFLFAPNGTVRFINSAGAVFRVFPPAPESELRFWLSLSFGYMVM